MFELLQYAIILLLGTSSVIASPIHRIRQSVVETTGATQGGVQPRLEVHQLQKDADQWNIFLLAMAAFQAMDPSDPLSWYQIAGIHGVPYIPYDGVQPCTQCSPTGYCAHSSTLFPLWHRGYVALFEQSLQANAIAVANQFSGDDHARYMGAATSLRMAYWDWALPVEAGQDPFPKLFTDTTVVVNTPNGQKNIANPLRSYSFGNADHSFMKTAFTPDSDVTVRNPTFTMQNRQDLRTDLYTTLTSNQGYNSFSTESLFAQDDNYNPFSIEMLHDRVHARVGGDMGYIPTAGFDPVFWMHHGAIDHAIALWQAAYPSDFVKPWAEVGATFTYIHGSVQDAESPLTPFRANTATGFLTSDAVRDITSLGYTYPDLASGQSAASIINSLYGNGQSSASKRDAGNTSDSNTVTEYIADITADSMGTEGTFSVFFFDGDFNETDVSSWHTDDSLIASHAFFTGAEKKGNGTALSNAGVSLTEGLRRAVEAGKLSSMEKPVVQRYLKANLQWRVRMLHGKAVEASSIPGFAVSILTSEVEGPITNDELPVWSPFKRLRL